MLRSGRAHWVTVSGIIGILALIVVLVFGGDSPASTTNRFMNALADGDVDTLMSMSYYDGSKESLKEQWEFATKVAGRYYRFRWQVVTVKEPTEKSAAVKLMVERNVGMGSVPEKMDVPLVRPNGRWLVDVKALHRGLYPALPR